MKRTDKSSKVADLTTNGYNTQFRQGMYAHRFGDELNFASETEILLAADRQSRQDSDLRILDYGVGSGRAHYVYSRLAEEGKALHLVGFDVALEGLKQYEEKLRENGFQKTEGPSLLDISHDAVPSSMIGPTYQKENMRVTLVYGNPSEPVTTYHSLLQKLTENKGFNLTVCEFGPLSNINGRINRQQTLRAFGELTNGELLVTVPNDTPIVRSSYKTLCSYESASPEQRQAFNLESEGDIVYRRDDSPDGHIATMFYHLYSPSRLQEDFERAGLFLPCGIRALKIKPETQLIKLEGRERIEDDAVTTALGNSDALGRANFLLVNAVPKRYIVRKTPSQPGANIQR